LGTRNGYATMPNGDGFDYGRLPPDVRDDLKRLTAEILHGEKNLTRGGVGIGQALRTAKTHLKHGDFGEWCDLEFGYKPRTAQRYMNAALLFAQHGAIIYALPLTAAQDLGAAAVAPGVVNTVIARLQRGERVTVEWVKEAIRPSKESSTRTDQSSSRHSKVMAAMITEAIDLDLCALLQAFVLERPAGRVFLADLAEHAAMRIRKTSAARARPVTLSLTAG
jgi:hypothetical protein